MIRGQRALTRRSTRRRRRAGRTSGSFRCGEVGVCSCVSKCAGNCPVLKMMWARRRNRPILRRPPWRRRRTCLSGASLSAVLRAVSADLQGIGTPDFRPLRLSPGRRKTGRHRASFEAMEVLDGHGHRCRALGAAAAWIDGQDLASLKHLRPSATKGWSRSNRLRADSMRPSGPSKTTPPSAARSC